MQTDLFFFFNVAPSLAVCTHWAGNTHLYPRGATLLRWRRHYSIRPVDGTAGPTTIPCSHPCRYRLAQLRITLGAMKAPFTLKAELALQWQDTTLICNFIKTLLTNLGLAEHEPPLKITIYAAVSFLVCYQLKWQQTKKKSVFPEVDRWFSDKQTHNKSFLWVMGLTQPKGCFFWHLNFPS